MTDVIHMEKKAAASSAPMRWYVVHTKPRAERVALQHLTRQGYQVYLPVIKVLRAAESAFEPMFPRYAFFAASAPGQSIAPVRSTVGVSSVVRFGNVPAVMPEPALKHIRSFESWQHEAGFAELSGFKPGKAVFVSGGPLAGMEGLVSHVAEDRVIVLLQMLGRELHVSASPQHLKVAADA